MDIELGTIPQWGQFAVGVIGVAAGAWAYLTKSAGTEAHQALKQTADNKMRLDRHEVRLTSIETALRHLPSAESVQELRIGQERLQGDLKVVMERVGPIGEIARRMQDVMISEGRR